MGRLLTLALVLNLGYTLLQINMVIGDNNIFDVMDFGAAGDGFEDDSQAFQKAWDAACNSVGGSASMLIPVNRTILAGPADFNGPCKATNVNIQILGTLMAPSSPSTWNGRDPSYWLRFHEVNRLSVSGKGWIDGQGRDWWRQSCKLNPKKGCTKVAPTLIKFYNCNELEVRNLRIKNSPQTHLYMNGVQGADMTNLRIKAPEKSPNTDGIHIHASTDIRITKSTIGTGDDCISIGDRISDVEIDQINCGPGHGISVGSLGKSGGHSAVENIHVSNVNFYGTTNGARIKTWQGGKGYARSITFTNLNFINVANPVIIDQYYCDKRDNCPEKPDAVEVSDIRYVNFRGTSKTPIAVNLKCSKAVACTLLHFDSVNITAADPQQSTSAYCLAAYGDTDGYMSPNVPLWH